MVGFIMGYCLLILFILTTFAYGVKHILQVEGNSCGELFGDFTVSGKGESLIELPGKPCSSSVVFADEPELIPCNPNNGDWKCSRVKESCGKYWLAIEWDVASTRVIAWKVKF